MEPAADAVVTSSLLTDRLKAATQHVHVRLESELDVMHPDLTMQQYVSQLKRWYGFCHTWERRGRSAFSGKAASFFDVRRKTQLLVRDLVTCGVSANDLNAVPCSAADAIDFQNPSTALGVLYVIEGSTLGGAFIAKHIEKLLGLTRSRGLAYYMSYGEHRGVRWAETRRFINQPPFPIVEKRSIYGAVATFEYLSRWLQTK